MSEVFTAGWIGLGKLGLPMAGRLSGSGQTLSAFDLDPARHALAAVRGIETTAAAEDAVKGRDIVFTSLPDDRALTDAIASASGVLAHMKPGAILCETSTVSPGASAGLARPASDAGVGYLRLPVSGSALLAEAGAVTCFASGPRDDFERVRARALWFYASANLARRGRRGALRQARHQPYDRSLRRYDGRSLGAGAERRHRLGGFSRRHG